MSSTISPEPVEGYKMFTLYILRGIKNHLYVGVTNNLEERISRHKAGDGAEFTKRNKTFKLVYKETYKTLYEARKRENQIKGWRREKKENLIKFGHLITQKIDSKSAKWIASDALRELKSEKILKRLQKINLTK